MCALNSFETKRETKRAKSMLQGTGSARVSVYCDSQRRFKTEASSERECMREYKTNEASWDLTSHDLDKLNKKSMRLPQWFIGSDPAY